MSIFKFILDFKRGVGVGVGVDEGVGVGAGVEELEGMGVAEEEARLMMTGVPTLLLLFLVCLLLCTKLHNPKPFELALLLLLLLLFRLPEAVDDAVVTAVTLLFEIEAVETGKATLIKEFIKP